jgi:hypothetical protein
VPDRDRVDELVPELDVRLRPVDDEVPDRVPDRFAVDRELPLAEALVPLVPALFVPEPEPPELLGARRARRGRSWSVGPVSRDDVVLRPDPLPLRAGSASADSVADASLLPSESASSSSSTRAASSPRCSSRSSSASS